jgi:hypothetical protein
VDACERWNGRDVRQNARVVVAGIDHVAISVAVAAPNAGVPSCRTEVVRGNPSSACYGFAGVVAPLKEAFS